VFEDMGISADDVSAKLGDDGLLDATEQAELGFGRLGTMTADQFSRITAAVASGELSLAALQGQTDLTAAELDTLKQIGVLTMQQIEAGTTRLDNGLGDAAGAARELGRAIRSIPQPPTIGSGGGRGGFAQGGQFVVSGRPGTDQNLVAFNATAGETVTVQTPDQRFRGGGDNRALIAEIRALRAEMGSNVVRELRTLGFGNAAGARA